MDMHHMNLCNDDRVISKRNLSASLSAKYSYNQTSLQWINLFPVDPLHLHSDRILTPLKYILINLAPYLLFRYQ